MRHLWFWSFWHWSTESYRGGALLRGPVLGVGGHWDEWYRHEATAAERAEIAADGRDAAAQRRFAWWLARRWAREAPWDGARPPARFVLGQLAAFPPFDRWEALAAYRAGYGAPGIPAIVLAEGSAGEADDVRAVDAVAVPADAASGAPALVPEGFRADPAELATVRRAARSTLGGRGLATFLALWLAAGRRPVPRALGVALAAGWAVVAAIVVRLRVGADPGDALAAWCAALVALWAALTLVALGVAAVTGAALWRGGRRLAARLDRSEVRLRLRGGMTVHGASAGLPLALDTVLALAHAERVGAHSWLWRRVAGGLRERAVTWAATGVVRPTGACGRWCWSRSSARARAADA